MDSQSIAPFSVPSASGYCHQKNQEKVQIIEVISTVQDTTSF